MPGPSPKSVLPECRDIREEQQGGDTHSGPGDSSGWNIQRKRVREVGWISLRSVGWVELYNLEGGRQEGSAGDCSLAGNELSKSPLFFDFSFLLSKTLLSDSGVCSLSPVKWGHLWVWRTCDWNLLEVLLRTNKASQSGVCPRTSSYLEIMSTLSKDSF